MKKLKVYVDSFGRPFKILFCSLFAVYILAWLFTMHLASIQRSERLSPILPVLAQDSQEYADLAQSMLHGKGFFRDGQSEMLRVPGYPSFVATFYSVGGYFLVTLVQILLVFLSALFIRQIGIVFSDRKVGELAAAVFLFSPIVFLLSLVILTDTLFLFLFLLGFCLAISLPQEKFWFRAILVSVIFACAIYVRPMGVFAFPVFVAPFLVSKFSWKEKIKSIVVMCIIIPVLLSPWIYRNYELTGVADFSSFKMMNLACCSTSLYLANKNGTTPAQEMTNIAKGSGVPETEWRNLKYSPKLSAYTENIILKQPLSYALYHVGSSLPFLFSSSLEELVYVYKSAMNIPIVSAPGAIHDLLSGHVALFFQHITAIWYKVAERIILLLMYAVALFGVWKERKNIFAWVFLCIPLYLMVLSGPAANVRYFIQGLPFILLLFSFGFFHVRAIITDHGQN